MTLDCYQVYLWSIGMLRLPTKTENNLFNELNLNQRSESYE